MLCNPAIVAAILCIMNYVYYITSGFLFSMSMTLFILITDLIIVVIINYLCLLEYNVLAWILAILPIIDMITPNKFKNINMPHAVTDPSIKPATNATTNTNKKKESFGEFGRPISTMDYGSTPYSSY